MTSLLERGPKAAPLHAQQPRLTAAGRPVLTCARMSTSPHTGHDGLSWFDGADAPSAPGLETCIHCGLCLTACPTYRTLRTEPDSPRGRIYLMRGLLEGRIEPGEDLVTHLDRCLDCRACETACPAGVPYSQLLEASRAQIERRVRRATPLRLFGRWVLNHVLPDRGRMHLAADLLRLSQAGPLGAAARAAARRGWLPQFAARGLEMTPVLEPRAERALERVAARLPEGARMEARSDGLVFVPAGTAKAKVAFHTSCVMETMFAAMNHETVRLLVIAGAEVHVPHAQGCCGALHAHGGEREQARRLARANVRAFGDDCEFVVSNSAGCGAALRDAGHLLEHDAAAEAFAGRVRDVSEVLDQLGLPPAPAPLHAPGDPARPLAVTYHDACHLAHAQKVREAPRRLLRTLPGVRLTELPNADWCCGSAGVYNLQQPALADAQLEQKLDAVESVEPDMVVASNPGCLMHLRRGAAERGSAVTFAHLVELLGAAYPAGARRG
jgi:glycolate oxidase iron-sulfur subunit